VTASVLLPRHERPRWRGRLHGAAFWLCLPAGLSLVTTARPDTRPAVGIYVIAIATGFGVSAAYHLYDWSPTMRQWMQRLDHSCIFVVIAGSYAPVCLYALPADIGQHVLVAISIAAVVGALGKLWWFEQLRRVGWVLYLGLGWAAVVAIPRMAATAGLGVTALVITGGLAYTIGTPVVLLRRPDPWPQVFGYHEVWHTLTVVAAAVHFGAVTRLVT
jgi:hemolysin III